MDLNNFELCQALFRCNRLEGCFLHTAIGDRNGVIKYRPHASHARNRLVDLCDATYEYGERSIEVPCQTLDTLFVANGIVSVDLLKVDIEGAEQFLLDSIGDWADRVRFILLELHHNIDLTWARRVLSGAGFEITVGAEQDRMEWWCRNTGV